MSDKKDYQALYLKYKTKYLDLKNSGGASSTRSKSPNASKPARITYSTKFDRLNDYSPDYTNAESECNKVYANTPDKKCKHEEIIKTYEDIKYTQLESEYSIYIKNYPEILSRIDKAAIKWADFIKKSMEENRTCKAKIFRLSTCDNFDNYINYSDSKTTNLRSQLIYDYTNEKIRFSNNVNLKPELFVDFLDVVTSPNYEDYIKNPSKLIIQSELPFKPTNDKENDIKNLFIQYSTFKKYRFI